MSSRLTGLAARLLVAIPILITASNAYPGELPEGVTVSVIAEYATTLPRLEKVRLLKVVYQPGAALEDEVPLRSVPGHEIDRRHVKGYGLLTDRPLLVVVNTSEQHAAEPMARALASRIEVLGAAGLTLSASVESDIAGLDRADQAEFLDDLGLAEPALSRFIRTAYALVDLISFFTVNPAEVRAWTVRRGTRARPAAGKIHSDLERGFIRAEVTPFHVFMEYGSEAAVKDAGKLRIEGKEYVLADGDIMHVRFNV